MAANDILAALQEPLQTSGDTYAGIGAGAVAQNIPSLMNPYASTGENAAYLFGGSILSALLSNMAKSDAAEQNAAIAGKQFQFMNSDPFQQAAMTQADPRTFAKLQAALATNTLMQKAQDNQTLRELQIKEPFQIAAENRAKGAATAPTFDTERNLTNDFTKHPVVQDFKYKETNLKALEEAYKDIAGTSDFEMLRRTTQMVEPGLAVRQDDQESLQKAASALGVTKSYIDSIVNGTSKNDPSVRAGMMRIAQRAYDASLGNYNTLRTNFVDRATQARLNPSLVVPYGEGVPFKQLYPALDISLGSSGNTSAGKPKVSDYLANGYTIEVVNGVKSLVPPKTSFVSAPRG